MKLQEAHDQRLVKEQAEQARLQEQAQRRAEQAQRYKEVVQKKQQEALQQKEQQESMDKDRSDELKQHRKRKQDNTKAIRDSESPFTVSVPGKSDPPVSSGSLGKCLSALISQSASRAVYSFALLHN